MQTQQAMFGDSLKLRDEYRIWWSYIPHFLHAPGYVYAYAFGDLLVRALYARSREADISNDPDRVWEWARAGWELVPEALEDRARWSYVGVDDPWRLAFTPGVRAHDVWVGGDQVLRSGQPTRVDADEVRRHAAEQAARLFARL